MTLRPVRELVMTRHEGGTAWHAEDMVAVEEPLEIHVDGEPLAVLMRTPGRDRELVAGLLRTEGIIEDVHDLQALDPCRDPERSDAHNVYFATLSEGCVIDPRELVEARRSFFASASCGLCGKATIDQVLQDIVPQPTFATPDPRLLATMGDRARKAQTLFEATGGLHACALFAPPHDRALMAVAEDVGRHNAMDKTIGSMLLADRLPLDGHTFWISGRAGFEMVQKALMAGASTLVCVGAPTSLAVELAHAGRLTLVGFATRPDRYNVYSGPPPPVPTDSQESAADNRPIS